MDAGRPGAAEEVQVVVLAVDASVFLRPVANAEVHPLVLAFRHRDADRTVSMLTNWNSSI